jgi:trigger factor
MAASDDTATGERLDDELEATSAEESDEESSAEEAPEKLNLSVLISQPSACQRHITVTIPRTDIDRYFDKAFSELMTTAAVPGFRPGRVPRKLVEARFRKDAADQVKGSLLMDSIAQLTDEHELSAISEPDLDAKVIEVPETGPMTYEFDLEVRPEFDLPEWRGLKIERPVRDFTEEDVHKQLQNLLTRHGRLIPHDGPAHSGDYVVVNLTFRDGEQVLSSGTEEVIRIRPVLSFRDGKIEAFDKLMEGAVGGETRSGTVRLSQDAPNERLRGKEVTAEFEVLEVKKLELPELTPAFLDELGGFESDDELRESIRQSLERRLTYHQQQRAREQVLAALTVAADWELPPDLLRRQSRRELERQVMELRRSGFNDDEIRAHANELRQNSQKSTARALKEHFILERLAEEQGIEESEEDFIHEIALIASQSGESPRRVRAQIEKRGMMDVLRNQIIERKTIELVLSHAEFKDVPFEHETTEAEAVSQAAGGGEIEESEIPEIVEESEE